MSPEAFGGMDASGLGLGPRERGAKIAILLSQTALAEPGSGGVEKISGTARGTAPFDLAELQPEDIMAKPPEAPPSSDIDGVHRDRVHRLAPETFDAKAQEQLDAENRESVGRPDQDQADQPKRDPNIGVGN
jgi:hypothetical protein